MKPKVLIILPWLPFPLNTGGNQATFNCINALRNDIDFVIFNIHGTIEQKRELGKRWPEIKIYSWEKVIKKEKYTLVNKLLKKIRHYFLKNNVSFIRERVLSITEPEMEDGSIEQINQIIKDENIKIVQCEFMQTLNFVYTLPSDIKKIFIHHELGYVASNLYLNTQGLTGNLYYNYLYRKRKAAEIAALNMFDKIVTVSSIDAAKLKEEHIHSEIVPSFCIVEQKFKYEAVKYYKQVLSFVGPENHPPNKIGITWFLNKVWPLILRDCPEMKIQIIGNWSLGTRKMYETKYQNLTFTGFVNNLQQVLKNTLMIVPITIGSGIRMKILEAANMGIPIITTTVGVEGIPLRDKIECLIADTTEDFANCIKFLNDIEKQKEITTAAHHRIKEYYSAENLRKSRLPIYLDLVKDEK